MSGHDDSLRADAERLTWIALRVLEGEPIENFDLGEYEIFVVTGFTAAAMELAAK